jgi:pyridoxamine 5'-phosphate oxidase
VLSTISILVPQVSLAAKVRFDTSMADLDTSGNGELGREAIRAMRRSYGEVGIDEMPTDPFIAFAKWLKEAHENPVVVEANAMVLSTLGGNEHISTRTVLLKDISEGGFTFFSNYSSRKAEAMAINTQVTLLFPWYVMERQVSISGFAEKISEAESTEYFVSRPWSSQIGAWASAQSAPLSSRAELEQRFAGAAEKWPEGSVVPKPPHWGGYRVTPIAIEFWQGRYSRLHDRLRYERANISAEWEITRYYP